MIDRRVQEGVVRGHIIVEARGNGRVQEAIIARVDVDWRVIPGTARTLGADTV